VKVLFAGPDPEIVMANSGHDRKKGVHLSDITKRMIFERDAKLNPESPIDAMVLERGFTWETVLERSLSERHTRAGYRPDQLLEDGIWMSPDWINEDGDIQHEEWKATKKSLRQVHERGFGGIGWTWIYNTKAYLRALLRHGIAKTFATRFRVWFINGDYSYETKTSDWHLLNDYWRFDIEFSRRELDENWRSILSYGRKYGLLKAAPSEEKCQSQEKTTTAASPKRKPGPPPPPSRGTGKVLTFPSTKKPTKS
jgi:hypothetical protein